VRVSQSCISVLVVGALTWRSFEWYVLLCSWPSPTQFSISMIISQRQRHDDVLRCEFGPCYVCGFPVGDQIHRIHTSTGHTSLTQTSLTQTHSFVPVQPPKYEKVLRLDPKCLDRKLETFDTSQVRTGQGNGIQNSTWYLSLRTGQHSRRWVPYQVSYIHL